MSNYQYTIALMIFLVAYGLFEVPSNGSCIYLPLNAQSLTDRE